MSPVDLPCLPCPALLPQVFDGVVEQPAWVRQLAWVLVALPLAMACDGDDEGASQGAPPPTEQLHAPGDLRLTSAGKTPRLPLRYLHAEGHSQAFRTHVSVEHSAAGQRSRVGTELDWERTVLSRGDNQAEIRMRVLRVRAVSPGLLRDTLAPQLGRLTIQASVDQRGRVIAVKFPGGSEPPGGKDLFARFTAPLPEDSVGDGATWERIEPFTLTLPRLERPVSVGLSTRYRLTLPKGKGARAVVTGELRLHVVHTLRQRSEAQGISGGGKGTAEWVLDLERQEPAGSHSSITLDLAVTTHGRRQALKQTMTVRTRPIPLPSATPRPAGQRP